LKNDLHVISEKAEKEILILSINFKRKIMESKIISPVPVYTTRLVKSEDLNHHGTLFAGRTAEWFVESGFIAAASIVDPKHIVCLKIHGMHFRRPVKPGEILKFTAKIIFSGSSSFISHVEVFQKGSSEPYVNGFITFIHVDDNSKATPHGIEIQPITEEDKILFERARNLKKDS
jgi:acyl-CoA hydrolase